ncbi:MAG TPA: glycosyltransferase, partial [Solirubrobacteraceae bacterium]|nr:glycosyltransferase [Solirubrobacteraceae bacterium]
MRVVVDARHLGAGRGVARHLEGVLRALGEAYPEDEWLAFAPGRAPLAPPHPAVRLVRHPLPSRALFGAAALCGRPRLDRLVGGALDAVWAPAPAPLALSGSLPLVLTVHDRSFEARPRDFTPYERVWHRLARPRALAARAALVLTDTAAVRSDLLAAGWPVAPERLRVVPPG